MVLSHTFIPELIPIQLRKFPFLSVKYNQFSSIICMVEDPHLYYRLTIVSPCKYQFVVPVVFTRELDHEQTDVINRILLLFSSTRIHLLMI